jgi:Protein of unknown function (DUF2846)
MRRWLWLLVLLVAGCATPVPPYEPPASPPAGQANLIIYRPLVLVGAAWGTDFLVDGKEIATLRNFSYTRVLVKAGAHQVRAGSLTVDLHAASGQTYYVRYWSDIGSAFFIGKTPIVQASGGLELVPSDAALAEIQNHRFVKPLIPSID